MIIMGQRRKKKAVQKAQMKLINEQLKRASIYIYDDDIKKLAKQTKTAAQRAKTIETLGKIGDYISEREEMLDYWRNSGSKTEGPFKINSSLQNMEKYYLLKRYYELVKMGYIKADFILSHYEDVIDHALEEMSDEELSEVIAEAEERKAKTPLIDFEKGIRF